MLGSLIELKSKQTCLSVSFRNYSRFVRFQLAFLWTVDDLTYPSAQEWNQILIEKVSDRKLCKAQSESAENFANFSGFVLGPWKVGFENSFAVLTRNYEQKNENLLTKCISGVCWENLPRCLRAQKLGASLCSKFLNKAKLPQALSTFSRCITSTRSALNLSELSLTFYLGSCLHFKRRFCVALWIVSSSSTLCRARRDECKCSDCNCVLERRNNEMRKKRTQRSCAKDEPERITKGKHKPRARTKESSSLEPFIRHSKWWGRQVSSSTNKAALRASTNSFR